MYLTDSSIDGVQPPIIRMPICCRNYSERWRMPELYKGEIGNPL